MKKNKLSIIFAIITIVCIFSVAAIVDQCECRTLLPEEGKNAEESEKANGEKEEGPPKKEFEEPPEKEPKPQPDAVEYDTAFGIDYDNPDKYLSQGEQSKISDTKAIEKLYSEKKDMDHLCSIYNWLTSEFSSFTARGGHIGVVTVDQLLKERKLGGCHDYALVYSAVARHFGYPSVMLETASISWIKQFQEDREKAKAHKGHVFVEIYLDNKWILIDTTSGWYVKDNYNPAEPVIPLDKNNSEQQKEIYGYYAYLKGLDSWEMNIQSNSDTQNAMDETAIQIDLDNIHYPGYEFGRFFR